MCKTNIHTDYNQHFHRGIQMSVPILIFIYLFHSKLVLCILTTQKLVTKISILAQTVSSIGIIDIRMSTYFTESS